MISISKVTKNNYENKIISQFLDIKTDLIFILLFYIFYTATLKSLRASLREVFRSVEALRWPMIRAQGT